MSKASNRPAKHRQPSKAARQKVRDAFGADQLAHLCETWDFREHADLVTLPAARDGRERFYWHADNGADVLAVAHLDTVQDDRSCTVMDTAAGLLAASGALDDRLGAYVILDMLPRLGITTDILLTTDEEIGRSTAEDFTTDKDYRYIIQFDRGGTDVVMYDYETDELCEAVELAGARVGRGSFSDICMLDHLGCAGINWGVGYRDYHSERSHAWLEDTFRMVARYVKFHHANAGRRFDHEQWTPAYGDGWQGWDLDREADRADTATRDLERFGGYGGWLAADCGHLVDLDDESTFVELAGTSIVCAACEMLR